MRRSPQFRLYNYSCSGTNLISSAIHAGHALQHLVGSPDSLWLLRLLRPPMQHRLKSLRASHMLLPTPQCQLQVCKTLALPHVLGAILLKM